jgi:hypothetical protein
MSTASLAVIDCSVQGTVISLLPPSGRLGGDGDGQAPGLAGAALLGPLLAEGHVALVGPLRTFQLTSAVSSHVAVIVMGAVHMMLRVAVAAVSGGLMT